MRWFVRIGAALLIAWFLYGLWPFLSLYSLAQAVEAHDVEGVRRRINARALRLSLVRQTVDAALDAAGPDLDLSRRRLATDAAISFAEPLAARLVNPETVIDLLDDGWPQSLAPERTGSTGGLRTASLARLWRVYLASEWRGFRAVVITLPPDGPADEQYRLRLRLSGGAWRLVDLGFPLELRRRVVREFDTHR